jgi:hypothetical protein
MRDGNSKAWDEIDPEIIASHEAECGPITASDEVKEAVARFLLSASFEDLFGTTMEELVAGKE